MIKSAWLLHPSTHKSPLLCGYMSMQPSSEHLASLALCLRTSAAGVADPLVTPASNNILEFSVDVTVRSRTAGLPKSQWGIRMSAGLVLNVLRIEQLYSMR